MAKAKQRHSRNESASSPSGGSKGRVGTAQRRPSDDDSTPPPPPPEMSGRSWLYWFYNERQGISWVLGCIVVAISLGFGVGTGFMTGELGLGLAQKPWRVALGASIRSSAAYQVLTLQKMPWEPIFSAWNSAKSLGHSPDNTTKNLREDPSNPRVFAVLREAIVRENGGYVHYDLGFLVPAPCGASRGIGMVRSIYTNCQKNCMPGIAKEKLAVKGNSNATDHMNTHSLPTTYFMQEEVLIRIPLSYQMTRKAALDVLLPLIPADAIRKAPLNDLDDAAILVLFLAHERGVGRTSRWLPYIASLPLEPSCGYSKLLRPYMLDAINALGEEIGLDVNGWPEELWKATQYADRIANGLARDYGLYLKTPEGITTVDNIKWALCQIASRATGGSQKHGALRMVPVLDLINHDANAGGFVELTGTERLGKNGYC